MNDKAQFEVRLIDRVTAPSKSAERALMRLERRMRRTTGDPVGGGRGSRRSASKERSSAKATERLEQRAARETERAHEKASRAIQQDIERNGKRAQLELDRRRKARREADEKERKALQERQREQAKADRKTRIAHRKATRERERIEGKLKESAEKRNAAIRSGVLGIGAAAGVALIATGALAYKIGEAALKATTFGQNSVLAFDQLAKHGVTGIQLFDHSRALAEKLALDVHDTADAYRSFLALQFSPADSDELIKLGADLQAFTGDAEKAAIVFRNIAKIKSQGKVQGDELMSLMEAQIPGERIFEAIAKRMDVEQDQVLKLMQAGKVNDEVAIGAIKDAVRDKLGEAALGDFALKAADTTIDGIGRRIKAKGQNLGIGLGQRIEKGLTKTAGSLLDRFDVFIQSPEGAKFMDDLGDKILRIVEGTERVIPKLEAFFAGFGTGAGEAADALSDTGAALGLIDEKSVKNVQDMGRAMGFLAVATAGVGAGFGLLLGPVFRFGEMVGDALIGPFRDSIFRLVDGWENIKAIWNAEGMGLGEKAYQIGRNVVVAIGGGIAEMVLYPINVTLRFASNLLEAFDIGASVRETGRNIMIGLGDGIADMLTYPLKKAGEAADLVVGAYRSVFDEHSPSKVLFKSGGNLQFGLGDGIEAERAYTERKAHRAGVGVVAGMHAGMGGKAMASASSSSTKPGFSASLFGKESKANASPLFSASAGIGPAARHRAMENRAPRFEGPATSAMSTPAALSMPTGARGGSPTINFNGDINVGGANASEQAADFVDQVRAALPAIFEDMELGHS